MQTENARERAFERALRASLTAGAAVPTGGCVDAETLAAWTEGALQPSEAASVESHLSSCPNCQAMLATFVRTSPPAQPAATPFWRRLHLNWLVPLATAAATVAIWLAVPGQPSVTEPSVMTDRAVADSSQTPSELRESTAGRAVPPAAPATPVPADSVAEARPPAQDAAGVEAQAKARAALAKQLATGQAAPGGRVAAVTATAPPLPANATAAAVEALARNRAEMDASKRADAAPPAAEAPPAAAAPLPSPASAGGAALAKMPPPPAKAADATVTSPAAPPSLGESVSVPAQSPALRTAFTDVLSPSSASRWRITAGGAVVYFGANPPAGRLSDIPPAVRITAGSAPSNQVCWMVGGAGAVYLTNDGLHFIRVAFPEALDLVAVRATDARTATVTASDGRTFQTTDAGKSWK